MKKKLRLRVSELPQILTQYLLQTGCKLTNLFSQANTVNEWLVIASLFLEF